MKLTLIDAHTLAHTHTHTLLFTYNVASKMPKKM